MSFEKVYATEDIWGIEKKFMLDHVCRDYKSFDTCKNDIAVVVSGLFMQRHKGYIENFILGIMGKIGEKAKKTGKFKHCNDSDVAIKNTFEDCLSRSIRGNIKKQYRLYFKEYGVFPDVKAIERLDDAWFIERL